MSGVLALPAVGPCGLIGAGAVAWRCKRPAAPLASPASCLLPQPPADRPSLPLLPRPHRRGKTNFFEKRVGEYQKSGVMASVQGGMSSFTLDADF